MRNKKLLTLLVCLAMTVTTAGTLASCGGGGETSSTEASTPAASTPADSSVENASTPDSAEESSTPDSSSEDPVVPPEVKTYTVTFDTGSGTNTVEISENNVVAEPTAPTKDYYTFLGWYNGETEWNFATDTVTANVTLTAKWEAKIYTIKYMVNGELYTEKTYTCENIASFEAPAVPELPGYQNGRWDIEPTDYLDYSEDAYYVNAEYDLCEWTVNFDVEGQTNSTTVETGSTLTEPTAPTKDYYNFDGWYNGDTKWNFATDVVAGEMTLTAKFTAKVYTVRFVDFDGNENDVTYTVENMADFELPTVPSAPAGSENARWDKTVEECLIFSEEVLVVNADSDFEKYTVTFVGVDLEPQEIEWGSTVASINPLRDGFVFAGWTLNGEAYDANTAITGDITLVAKWNVKSETVTDYVISATAVSEGTTVEEGYADKQTGVGYENSNKGWYFDSDYNGYTGAGATEENKFAELVAFALTVDGSNGTNADGRETYITLPAINYTLTKKVDFAYLNNKSSITAIDIYGTEVTQYGGNNKLISIITDENGTRLEFREINTVGVSAPEAVIELPESVINGVEGLTLKITVTAWTKFEMTELHATGYVVDTIEVYANTLYEAIANASAGSDEQWNAIEEYRAFYNKLNADEKAIESIVANVEDINAIIDASFMTSEDVVVANNVASIISGGQAKGEMNLTHEQNPHSKFNGTKYETFSYRQNSTNSEVTFTLNPFNFAEASEARFGVAFAVTADMGSLTVNGQTLTVPENLIGHFYNMEAVVADGYITFYNFASTDEVKNKAIGYAENGYFLRAQLSEAVLNGTEGLKLEFAMGAAYAWFEVTELQATMAPTYKQFIAAYDNEATCVIEGTEASHFAYTPAAHWGSSAKMDFETATYTNINFSQFNPADTAYNVAFTLAKFDFTQYAETYFGFTAATAEGDATVTVNGTSYTYDLNKGYYYVKMLVKGNTLTVIGDGASNAGQVLMTVELTEAQLNGTEAIVINWSTAGWSQVEITEYQAVTVASKLN